MNTHPLDKYMCQIEYIPIAMVKKAKLLSPDSSTWKQFLLIHFTYIFVFSILILSLKLTQRRFIQCDYTAIKKNTEKLRNNWYEDQV